MTFHQETIIQKYLNIYPVLLSSIKTSIYFQLMRQWFLTHPCQWKARGRACGQVPQSHPANRTPVDLSCKIKIINTHLTAGSSQVKYYLKIDESNTYVTSGRKLRPRPLLGEKQRCNLNGGQYKFWSFCQSDQKCKKTVDYWIFKEPDYDGQTGKQLH